MKYPIIKRNRFKNLFYSTPLCNRGIKLFLIVSLLFVVPATYATKAVDVKEVEGGLKDKNISQFNTPILHWKTKQGVPVYFIETHVLPMVDIDIAFKAGAAFDGKQPGLASLTNNLLNQGTKMTTANQIAEQFDLAGANYFSAVNRDMATVGIRTVTFPKQLNLALSTLKEVLAYPNFPEEAFKRIQKQTEQLLKYQEQNPDLIAGKQFFSKLYNQHPYASPILGTSDTLETIQLIDIQKFYQHYYTTNNAIIAIVGNLTVAQAKKVSETLTDALNKGTEIAKLEEVKKNGFLTEHIPFPSNQTHILMGQIALSRDDPNYYPLIVANHILGGDMASRLFKNVREEQGLAYNVGSGFSPLKKEGPFYVRLQTESSQTQKAVTLIKKMLNEFIEKGPSKDELVSAKHHLIQNFILKISTNQALVNCLIDIGFYGLPLNYLSTYQAKIQAVTANQIEQALKKHLSPERFVLITVGKGA